MADERHPKSFSAAREARFLQNNTADLTIGKAINAVVEENVTIPSERKSQIKSEAGDIIYTPVLANHLPQDIPPRKKLTWDQARLISIAADPRPKAQILLPQKRKKRKGDLRQKNFFTKPPRR